MIAIAGCPTVGNPWNVLTVGSSATSSTAASWPGLTTTVDDCLILEIIATGADIGTAQLGALTNGSYTSIVEQMDNWVTTGAGGGIGMVSATKATAGPTGSSTATLTTAATKAYMTLAMRSAIPNAVPIWHQRSPRPSEQQQVTGPYALPATPSQIFQGG